MGLLIITLYVEFTEYYDDIKVRLKESRLGLTASLDTQFFSWEFCGKRDSLLAKISSRVSQVSRLSRERKMRYTVLWSLLVSHFRVSQFTSLANKQIIIHCEELVLDPKFSQDSTVKISNDSCESRYEISVCETHKSRYKICLRDSQEASLAMKFLSAKLERCDSRYEIS